MCSLENRNVENLVWNVELSDFHNNFFSVQFVRVL